MKNVRQVVEDLGLQLTDDQVESLDRSIRENYVTRNEMAEKANRIQSLTQQVKELSEKVESGKDDEATIAALKSQLDEIRKTEEDRARTEEDAKRRNTFSEEFDKALGGREFINGPTRESVFEKAYSMRSSNPDMEVGTILETLTKDADNLWSNPQQQQPSAAVPNDNDSQAALLDFAKQLFNRQ